MASYQLLLYVVWELYQAIFAQEVRAVVQQWEGCRFDPTLGVSLSMTPSPDELVAALHGSLSPLECLRMGE